MKRRRSNSLLAIAALLFAALSVRALDRFTWSDGHGDLAVNYINNAWQWNAEEGREVGDVIIRLNDVTRKEIPPNPSFSFLGAAGDPIWIIPASQMAGIPFMGINAQATASGTFVNGRFDLFLSSVRGPGDFIMWTTTGTGAPNVLMNSLDGITSADRTDVPAGGHFHQNWGFTAPGTYRVGYTASGVLSGQSAPVVSDEAVYTFEASVLKHGEADIEVAYEAGELEFHIHDEVTDTEFDPSHVALQAGPATWQTVPAGGAFSFLGTSGTSVYVLPRVESEGVLFLGLAAGEVEAGVFVEDRLAIDLIGVDGPGNVFYYEIDEFGMPTVFFSSTDESPAAGTVAVIAGSHAHRNWTFSEPGAYRITLQASGTLAGGAEVRSEPTTFLFEVLPPVLIEEGEIDFEIAFESGEWKLGLLDEAAGRELSTDEVILVLRPAARQSVPEDPAFGFLGPAGAPVYILPQEETEGLLFLGLAADEIESGVFANETVRLEFIAATGPGTFALYAVDGFGEPSVFIDTGSGISAEDVFPMDVGSHTHANWAFSQPGVYKLSFRATGTLAGNNEPVASEIATLTFLIQESRLILNASLINDGQQLQIAWEGRTGVSYQLQARSGLDSGTWADEGASIPGTSGLQTTTVDIGTEVLRVFRLAEF